MSERSRRKDPAKRDEARQVSATLRYLRMSPKKVRRVVALVRGMSTTRAADVLRFTRNAPARPLHKLLSSAVANAEYNAKLDAASLVIKSITVNEGPTLKRFRPRARGSASPIRRRSSHITVILEGARRAEGAGKSAHAPSSRRAGRGDVPKEPTRPGQTKS